jgi:uncharacterized membrane protein YvbJ
LNEGDYYFCPYCGAPITERTKSAQELAAERRGDEEKLNFYSD